MPSFSLGLTPGTSQVISSAPLLIAGTVITSHDWDAYFPDPLEASTVADDRSVRDVDIGRRLSNGSSPRDAEDLSQDLPSSSPVTAATLCDSDMPETDDYIQEPAETMVIARPTALSTEPASLTDDHAVPHLPIKRRRDENDPDSVAGRDGMRLRSAVALKHKGCATH
ncbi:PREDICTED: uncharacterized protein LOC109205255 [Nicotiana attenuata]|uniref:uncharacterized protein LOC109205255 n=1 Tax=Nicotiana attenuata TaxID=49451 RepID=UPI000904648B|nr:PREDICTED: uncharacterized protein LOC109205255 [Nicotiana attenuata]XP_019223485.1 PREDICTED: uncharacterized protein LOC109205255 [Nicotiana attenuata]XP_019223486.1 PREDICTED: uncharacterized protein LOC109205255 [Nicotiana attenuata]XP_019223487.1 PREDICTED: uncharacterized protein LOC109205255 [Nicotiana attenuata]XP_019223488.1 PREDICTED: uncharacterized protein LOC109205255 [Nicotiana attenuata]